MINLKTIFFSLYISALCNFAYAFPPILEPHPRPIEDVIRDDKWDPPYDGAEIK